MTAMKINMESATDMDIVAGKMVKEKHDLQTQNVFRRVVGRAVERGIVVNNKKTKLLCISRATTYKAKAFIMGGNGSKLVSGDSMKVLGYHLYSRPTANAHASGPVASRRRGWPLSIARSLLITTVSSIIQS